MASSSGAPTAPATGRGSYATSLRAACRPIPLSSPTPTGPSSSAPRTAGIAAHCGAPTAPAAAEASATSSWVWEYPQGSRDRKCGRDRLLHQSRSDSWPRVVALGRHPRGDEARSRHQAGHWKHDERVVLDPVGLTNVGGTLFRADDGTHGRELWRSDGTRRGTKLVRDIYPGASSDPYQLTDLAGRSSSATDGRAAHGRELWRSDGTAAGTALVRDIYPTRPFAGNSSRPSELTNLGGTLFFSAHDGTHGGELWRSDGTAVGTTLVRDIRPGCCNLGPNRSRTSAGPSTSAPTTAPATGPRG